MTESQDDSSSPNSRQTRKTWWRIAQIAFLVIALGYFGIKISQNWSEYKTSATGLDPHWHRLAVASLIVLGTYAMLIQSWRILISGAGSRLSYVQAVRIWTIANLGRYIPGKVASIAALGVLAKQEGVSATAAASAAILGTLINIGAGFGIVAISGNDILSSQGTALRTTAIALTASFVAGVIALPWVLPPLAKFAARILSRPAFDVRVGNGSLWLAVTINALSWFSYGWAFMVFSQAMLPGIHGTLLQFVGVWAFSYLIGYLAFFSPGGLGFREVAMVAGLTALAMTDSAGAGIIAAASRLWLSVLELLPGLVALLLTPASKRLRPKGD